MSQSFAFRFELDALRNVLSVIGSRWLTNEFWLKVAARDWSGLKALTMPSLQPVSRS